MDSSMWRMLTSWLPLPVTRKGGMYEMRRKTGTRDLYYLISYQR